jgi:hypothetical protein
VSAVARRVLVPYTRPRVLAVDFSTADVNAIARPGFHALGGASGLYDGDRFLIPCSAQDVDVLLFNIAYRTLSGLQLRRAHKDSVEREPVFKALVSETLKKGGWVMFFVAPGCTPHEFTLVGFDKIGVHLKDGRYRPTHFVEDVAKKYGKPGTRAAFGPVSLPPFKATTVEVNASPEAVIVARHLSSAKLTVLAAGPISTWENMQEDWLVTNETEDLALALKISDHVVPERLPPAGEQGGDLRERAVLFLPQFGDDSVKVAIELLQNVIPTLNASLFDSPEKPWLDSYLPPPVVEIRAIRERLENGLKREMAALELQEEGELERYRWLLGLLYHKGDQLCADVTEALRFLAFSVMEVDTGLAEGEPKKEDLHIKDEPSAFFAVGEAKGTGRGPQEAFLDNIGKHQKVYGIEHECAPPAGILVVNHSLALDPAKRPPFYKHLKNRCEAERITAVDSVALFSMCQAVLKDASARDAMRSLLMRPGVVTVEDLKI